MQTCFNFEECPVKARNPRGAGRKPVNIAGRKFGRLTAVREFGRGPGGHVMWICRCECGANVITSGDRLRLGRTLSCGCRNAEKGWARMHGILARREV